MNPGFFFAILGKNARDLLYSDYAQQKPLRLGHKGDNWSFDFSCQIEEILPGLNSVFGVTFPDSGKAELQYLRDFVGFSAGVGLKANPKTKGFEPIANISAVIGTTVLSLGAELGIDITKRKLNQFSTGLSLNTAFLIASLALSDDFKGDNFNTVRASFYHPVNPRTRTAVAAELKYKFSDEEMTITVGAQHALLPCTLVKARMDSDGKVSAAIRQQLWRRLYVSVAGEVDLSDMRDSMSPRFGLSMALKP